MCFFVPKLGASNTKQTLPSEVPSLHLPCLRYQLELLSFQTPNLNSTYITEGIRGIPVEVGVQYYCVLLHLKYCVLLGW